MKIHLVPFGQCWQNMTRTNSLKMIIQMFLINKASLTWIELYPIYNCILVFLQERNTAESRIMQKLMSFRWCCRAPADGGVNYGSMQMHFTKKACIVLCVAMHYLLFSTCLFFLLLLDSTYSACTLYLFFSLQMHSYTPCRCNVIYHTCSACLHFY